MHLFYKNSKLAYDITITKWYFKVVSSVTALKRLSPSFIKIQNFIQYPFCHIEKNLWAFNIILQIRYKQLIVPNIQLDYNYYCMSKCKINRVLVEYVFVIVVIPLSSAIKVQKVHFNVVEIKFETKCFFFKPRQSPLTSLMMAQTLYILYGLYVYGTTTRAQSSLLLFSL